MYSLLHWKLIGLDRPSGALDKFGGGLRRPSSSMTSFPPNPNLPFDSPNNEEVLRNRGIGSVRALSSVAMRTIVANPRTSANECILARTTKGSSNSIVRRRRYNWPIGSITRVGIPASRHELSYVPWTLHRFGFKPLT